MADGVLAPPHHPDDDIHNMSDAPPDLLTKDMMMVGRKPWESAYPVIGMILCLKVWHLRLCISLPPTMMSTNVLQVFSLPLLLFPMAFHKAQEQ